MPRFIITSLLVLASFAVRADEPLMLQRASYPVVTEVDPLVQELMELINSDSIMASVQHLEDYGTRTYFTPQAFEAQNWLQAKFEAITGLDVEIQDIGAVNDPWHSNPSYASGNVIAVQKGKIYSNEYIVCGGHYDSYTHTPHNPDVAPGADDNASGIAGVLELARILSQYEFQRPIVYCCFAAEEIGLYGSGAYASRCKQQEMNILGYFNIDMIGYLKSGTDINISVVRHPSSADLGNYYTNIVNVYFPEIPVTAYTHMYGDSDHSSFVAQGYQSVYPFENNSDYSPYIHTPNDIVGLSVNSPEQCRVFTQTNCASIATLAGLLYETTLPVPAFSASNTTITEGDATQFSDLTINEPVAWHWYFEGGTPTESMEQNPQVSYATPGKYDVKLVVTNSFGSDSLLRPTYITVKPFPPIADFVADATEIEAGDTVAFTNLSQNNPQKYQWFFEGGSPMQTSQENPVVRFAKAGSYSVLLTASNESGESTEIKKDYITVTEKVGIGEDDVETRLIASVQIYPNPTGNELKIAYARHSVLDTESPAYNDGIAGQARNDVTGVEIFDMLGKKQLSTFNFQFSTLDISHLPVGVYFVRIQTENGVIVRKVVKK